MSGPSEPFVTAEGVEPSTAKGGGYPRPGRLEFKLVADGDRKSVV